jgi:hypothetical protein
VERWSLKEVVQESRDRNPQQPEEQPVIVLGQCVPDKERVTEIDARRDRCPIMDLRHTQHMVGLLQKTGDRFKFPVARLLGNVSVSAAIAQ